MSDQATTLLKQAYRARREKRPADARRDFRRAVELSRASGVRRDLIEALKGLGQIERDLGYLDAALALYDEAAVLCREEDDALLLAHTVRHVGDLHQEAGRLEPAESCYDEALRVYRGHPQTSGLDLANAIRPLAILREKTGEGEQARRLWEEARHLYAAAAVEEGVQECAAHLARLAES